MSTQRALLLPAKQGNWQVGEADVPTPGPKDVLVKIMATGLNPIDWKIQTYGVLITDYPYIAGMDGAGVVQEVGTEVTNVVKGDRVAFQGWIDKGTGTFQQYAIVPAEITAKIPSNISFDQAASIPVGLGTVVAGTWNKHPQARSIGIPAPWEEGGETKFANKPAVILGGSSSVGQYAIQLARLNKFSPIITTASLHNESWLKSLGATHVLDRSLAASDTLSSLQKITEGKPIEYIFDAVSLGDTQALAYQTLAPGAIPKELKVDGDGKKVVHVFGSTHAPTNTEIAREVFGRLTAWLEDGVIVPNKVEVLPGGLAGIPDGLERLKQNKVSGTKLVARPQETV
ncbi:GroES-like protein [Daedaleopsis nitida]|nr:GroES-like protein [Daedaleopsis nitida]